MVTGGRRWQRTTSLHSGVCTFPTTQALLTSSEKPFLHGCSTSSPYISRLPLVSSHELPNPPWDSDDSLRELGFGFARASCLLRKPRNGITL